MSVTWLAETELIHLGKALEGSLREVFRDEVIAEEGKGKSLTEGAWGREWKSREGNWANNVGAGPCACPVESGRPRGADPTPSDRFRTASFLSFQNCCAGSATP